MIRKPVLAAAQLGIGLLLAVSALALYFNYLRFMYELTFMSNFLAGLFFLTAGALTLAGRRVPQILYLCFTVLLILVMGTCLAFMGNFSFSGSFLFLHLINPLVVTLYFVLACDMREVPIKLTPAAVLMPAAYLLFALIFGAATGNYIYFFLDYGQVGTAFTAVFILAAAAALLLVSLLLWLGNRLLRGAGAGKGRIEE